MPVYRDLFIKIKDLWTQASIKGPVSGPKTISLKPGCLDAVLLSKNPKFVSCNAVIQVAAL